MTEERPRNLKAMLTEAKDTSDLMLDLAYAGLFYADKEVSQEVLELEEELTRLVHAMREVCLLASRSPSDAAGLASLLQVIGAIETMGNQAVDIAKIVIESIGIPAEMRADLMHAEEITDRMTIREQSRLDGRSVEDAELAVHGVRLLGIRKGSAWRFDPEDEEVLSAGDVLVVRGPDTGINEIRQLAGVEAKAFPQDEQEPVPLTELDKAIDIVVEMKDLAEVCMGLAYASVLFADRALAAEVNRIEDRLDDMRETLESWILEAAFEARARGSLRGLLHLAVASETIGDAAQAMVWLIEKDEELHPVISVALGEAEDTVLQAEVESGSTGDGKTLEELELSETTGMTVLAISSGARWQYRPTGKSRIGGGDRLVLTGPSEAIEDVRRILSPAALAARS